MVNEEKPKLCGECYCTNGQVFQGMTFCYYYNREVCACSIMCRWGEYMTASRNPVSGDTVISPRDYTKNNTKK